MNTRIAILNGGVLLSLLSACERGPESSTSQPSSSFRDAAKAIKEEAKQFGSEVKHAAQEVAQSAKESALTIKDEAVKFWGTTKEEAVAAGTRAMDLTREQMAVMRDKVGQMNESARPTYEKALAELEAQAKNVNEKFAELRASAPEKWQQAREEVAEAVAKFKQSADAAAKEHGLLASQITGTVTYRERMALPPGAEVRIKLLDVSKADAPAVTIAEKTFAPIGQVPIAFELDYDAAKIEPSHSYALRAEIVAEGNTLFRTTDAVPVLANGEPGTVEIVLKRGE